ncbi:MULTISPECIES: hypothetical protein [unclassified Nonomuraea]
MLISQRSYLVAIAHARSDPRAESRSDDAIQPLQPAVRMPFQAVD